MPPITNDRSSQRSTTDRAAQSRAGPIDWELVGGRRRQEEGTRRARVGRCRHLGLTDMAAVVSRRAGRKEVAEAGRRSARGKNPVAVEVGDGCSKGPGVGIGRLAGSSYVEGSLAEAVPVEGSPAMGSLAEGILSGMSDHMHCGCTR